ncbi:MAG TPA: ScyD/ScyE family protein [Solirubrobacteraceae bacterium]|nr:ScyD/ScyE family protein [Solirubrobacteraceae bacterium]
MRHIRLMAGAGGLIAAATVAATAAGAGAAAAPKVKVAATGLNSPKHLLYTPKGILVAESGVGGKKGGSTCVPGPVTGGQGTTTYCEGRTAAIALITPTATKVVDGKLPSVVEEDSGEAAGPAAVALTSTGHRAVLYQDTLVTKTGGTAVTGPGKSAFGTLQLGSGLTVNLARYGAQHPQNPATFGGTPGETTYDSDPYSVTSYRGGYAATDAAGNSLLSVSSKGKIRLLARFPTVPETAPAGVFGPTAVTINAQAVPTSVAVGPDGALYVGLLRGVPSAPGTAYIYRVVPGHAPAIWAKGLTAVTAIAFDARGRLLATELSTGGLLAAGTAPGALVRISADGKKVSTLPVSGLSEPTGVAVAPDGTVYVSNRGTSPGSASKPGEVLKITGLK